MIYEVFFLVIIEMHEAEQFRLLAKLLPNHNHPVTLRHEVINVVNRNMVSTTSIH